MESFLDLVENIRSHPGLYLGSKSITKLYYFLHGIGYAERRRDPNYSDPIEEGFRDWVSRLLDVKLAENWGTIVLLNSADDTSAFDVFYGLFDRYLDETWDGVRGKPHDFKTR